MRKISLLVILILLSQVELKSIARNENYELKAEQPVSDNRSETRILFGRIDQIEKAKVGDKLSSRLIEKSTRIKSTVARLNARTDKAIAHSSSALIKRAATATEKPFDQPAQKLSSNVKEETKSNRFNFDDVFAGKLKLIAKHQFSADPSLNIRLSPGERGLVVLRFERSVSESFKLHPPTIFFAGRDLPVDQMKEQQQRFDDPYADTQQISLIDNGFKNLSNWFPWMKQATDKPHKLEHLNFVYVPLGTLVSYNKLGHYYLYNVVSTATTIVKDKSLAQDEVTEVKTNDPDSLTKFYESAIRFELLEPGRAHVKVARVQYSGDRSILSSEIFEGDVTTSEVSKVKDDISSYTTKTWNQASAEFHL